MKSPLAVYMILPLFFALPASAGVWRDVAPGDRVDLPRDLYFQKDYRIQWWYFTGHLYDHSGREFGFELTFFAAGVQKRAYQSRFGVDTVYLSHASVTDVAGGRYYHWSDADAGAYGFSGAGSSRLRVWSDNASLEGTMRRMHISAGTPDSRFDLVLVPEKPVVLQGGGGYSRKSEESPLIASLYFSFTDLETRGTLHIGDSVFDVHGKSWFDREISSRGLAPSEAGWDWFAIRLDDGREIMLYDLRKKDGTLDPFSGGAVVEKDGSARHLKREEFTVTELDHYRSDRTDIRYPAKWEITVPSESLRLLVTPLVRDQEFTGAGLFGGAYWEGTCSVQGSETGRAYVELTGYGKAE
jgi:predicted secreted hydrolase